MTIPQVQALQAYWKKCPPVHLLVSWYLGYKAPEEDDELLHEESEMAKDQFVNVMPANDFDEMLRKAGLPCPTKE